MSPSGMRFEASRILPSGPVPTTRCISKPVKGSFNKSFGFEELWQRSSKFLQPFCLDPDIWLSEVSSAGRTRESRLETEVTDRNLLSRSDKHFFGCASHHGPKSFSQAVSRASHLELRSPPLPKNLEARNKRESLSETPTRPVRARISESSGDPGLSPASTVSQDTPSGDRFALLTPPDGSPPISVPFQKALIPATSLDESIHLQQHGKTSETKLSQPRQEKTVVKCIGVMKPGNITKGKLYLADLCTYRATKGSRCGYHPEGPDHFDSVSSGTKTSFKDFIPGHYPIEVQIRLKKEMPSKTWNGGAGFLYAFAIDSDPAVIKIKVFRSTSPGIRDKQCDDSCGSETFRRLGVSCQTGGYHKLERLVHRELEGLIISRAYLDPSWSPTVKLLPISRQDLAVEMTAFEVGRAQKCPSPKCKQQHEEIFQFAKVDGGPQSADVIWKKIVEPIFKKWEGFVKVHVLS